MWQYDDNEGIWEDQATDYSYDPCKDEFALKEQAVAMEEVPLKNRQELEKAACNGIAKILGKASKLVKGTGVVLTDEFEQNEEIKAVLLGQKIVFGSEGASPCLIVFSVGYSKTKNGYYAKGAHRDSAYTLGEEFIGEMLEAPEDSDWTDVSLHVVGGEFGSHTGAEEATMDYSRYYPFFLACQQANVQFGGVAFPSNPTPDDASSAAVLLANDKPSVKYWL